jgi:23S rRNA (uracil1939-C5)-methyltransferase
VVDVLRPSADRVDPACIHYTRDRCGGCQLQHLRYEEQLRVKSAIVRDALARIAGRPAPDVPATASPERWRYRRKLTLALRREAGGVWVAGLHRFDAPSEVFGLEMCPITDDGVLAVWRDVLGASAMLPDAAALRGAVRTTTSGYALVVEGGERWAQRAAFEAAVPALTEIWWVPDRGPRRRVGVGTGHLPGQTGALGVPTGTSFLQVNAAVGEALHADVVRRVLSYHPATAIDAYAGTGGTAVALARAGVRVVAIEADRDASAQCAAALPAGSRAQCARVEDALPRALPADVVVLNPPRQGVAPAVTAALGSATSPSRAIVYVSCDPATLARDIGRLPAWRMASVQAFDMFPQTAHVETVCELVPAGVPS